MQRAGIVLCGGRSRRMGRDKASLRFGPDTLLERVCRIVGERVDELVVVAREGQAVAAGAWRIARDPAEGLGPLAGIVAGLEEVSAPYSFVCACDAPLVEPALIDELFARAAGHDAALPRVDGYLVPTLAVWAHTALEPARARLARRELRPRDLAADLDVCIVEGEDLRAHDPDLRSFLDCNTPQNLDRALHLAGLRG